jgi:hypothetical protein
MYINSIKHILKISYEVKLMNKKILLISAIILIAFCLVVGACSAKSHDKADDKLDKKSDKKVVKSSKDSNSKAAGGDVLGDSSKIKVHIAGEIPSDATIMLIVDGQVKDSWKVNSPDHEFEIDNLNPSSEISFNISCDKYSGSYVAKDSLNYEFTFSKNKLAATNPSSKLGANTTNSTTNTTNTTNSTNTTDSNVTNTTPVVGNQTPPKYEPYKVKTSSKVEEVSEQPPEEEEQSEPLQYATGNPILILALVLIAVGVVFVVIRKKE